jgi:hypothetical protein
MYCDGTGCAAGCTVPTDPSSPAPCAPTGVPTIARAPNVANAAEMTMAARLFTLLRIAAL